MNAQLSQSRFLSLPVWDMPEKLMVYLALVLHADMSGEVAHTIDTLHAQTGIGGAVLTLVLESLSAVGLITWQDGVATVLDNKAFSHPSSHKSSTRKVSTSSKNLTGDISERITQFRVLLLSEVSEWNAHHPAPFPQEQVEEFFAYWTEHGPNDRKFRQESCDKWDWQRRLTTWFRRLPQTRREPSSLLKRAADERNLRQQSLDARLAQQEANSHGMEEYVRELQMAADGDGAMRRKYPNWQQLLLRHKR